MQGGVYPDLRAKSAALTVEVGFDGYAIGGLSVGEPNDAMYKVIEHTAPLLPADQPRYLMGVGTPDRPRRGVARGVDMFDCVMPTRNARNGQLFTSQGAINIKNACHAEDDGPVDPACGCYTCRHFSRAYLRHLFMAGEMTAGVLNTLHNLFFYLDTMRRIREAIAFGTFEKFRQDFHRTFSSPPPDRMIPTVTNAAGVLAMAAPPDQAVESVDPAHPVRPRPRHLLLRDPAADEAAAEEGAGVPRRAEGRRPVVTTGGIFGSIAKITDQSIQLQIAPNVRVDVSRAAIVGYQGQAPVADQNA